MNRALRHLLWKDTRMITPLVAVILAGTFVFYLMRWAASWSNNYLSSINLAVSLWLLMPNLMALGAPPMLVGSEEESGTLGWLRALPVPWPLVVVSKIIVAVVAVVLSWAVSSLLLWTVLRTGSEFLPVFSASLLQQNDIRHSGFFSFQLLCVGFFLTYLCRSPVLGLILLVPTIVALQSAVQYAESLLEIDSDANGLWWAVRMAIAVAYAVLLVLIPFLPASRRLARPRSRKSLAPPPALESRHTQPFTPSVLLSPSSRPGMQQALLWQAWRQQSRSLIGLSLLAALCIPGVRLRFSANIEGFVSTALLVLICTWMGCLCFYSDSISRRHFFFADRGYPKRHVWCSRLAAPSLAMAMVLVGLVVTHGFGARTMFGYGSVEACCVLGFACGMLSSMWMARSTLAFFVGPMLLLVIWAANDSLIGNYQDYFGYLAIAAVPLLFASWRLTGEWLKHTQGWMTQLRIAGYILLAIVLVPVTLFTVRFGTMPKPLPQWRAHMFAQPMPNAFAETHFDLQSSIAGYLAPWLAMNPLPIKEDGRLIDQPHLLWQETHRTLSVRRYDETFLENAARAAERILQWAKAARLAVLQGEISPTDVLQNADGDELAAMNQMYSQLMNSVHPTASSAVAIRDALSELASDKLREESWRMALAMEWRLYQSRRGSKVFAGEPLDVGYYFPGLEQRRADRNVDWAVYSLLGPTKSALSSPSDRTGNYQLYRWQKNPLEFHGESIANFRTWIEQELTRRGL